MTWATPPFEHLDTPDCLAGVRSSTLVTSFFPLFVARSVSPSMFLISYFDRSGITSMENNPQESQTSTSKTTMVPHDYKQLLSFRMAPNISLSLYICGCDRIKDADFVDVESADTRRLPSNCRKYMISLTCLCLFFFRTFDISCWGNPSYQSQCYIINTSPS